jgi:phosphatidate cytidylyltransferase
VLGPRILTALVMLGVLIPIVFLAPHWLWAASSLAVLAIAFNEWSALLPGRRPGAALWLIGLASGLTIAWLDGIAVLPQAFLVLLCLLSLAYWLIEAPRRLRSHRISAGGRPLALLLLGACWLALIDLRDRGTWVLVCAMAIVWIADIAAYFIGKAVGRHKLAPSISPGKSWEGAAGGVLAVAISGTLAAKLPVFAGTLPQLLVDSWGMGAAALVLSMLAVISVLGDLHESLLKRVAGVKDSGSLLPGHGGFLDRIDALVPTMPAVALIHYLLQ